MKIHNCFVNRGTLEVVKPQTVEELAAKAREEQQQRAERERQAQERKATRQKAIAAELKRHNTYTHAQAVAWEKASAASVRKLFNVESGKVENIAQQKSGRAMQDAFLEALKRGAKSVEVPPAIIQRGKINLELVNRAPHFMGLETETIPWRVDEVLKDAGDPPFPVPKGATIYQAAHVSGGVRFWTLEGNTLYLAVNSKGEPVKGGEGYKAQQARLELEAKAAAEEKANAAKLEAERAELERQEKQLEALKKLPKASFEKLLSMLK